MDSGRLPVSVVDRRYPRRLASLGTRWSVVVALERREDPKWEMSWATLTETYQRPMERYVRNVIARVSGRNAPPEECEEIVQSFLATCAEKDWLSRADPERGKFRAFVQHILRMYVYRYVEYVTAQKRTPPAGTKNLRLELDVDELELPPEPDPDVEHLDRNWVEVAVENALSRLREKYERDAEVIRDLIATQGEASPDLADRLGVGRQRLSVIKNRARERFSDLLEEEIRATVRDGQALEEEWRALRKYFP